MLRRFVLVLLFTVSVARGHAQLDGALKWAFTTLSSATPGAIIGSPALGADGAIYFGVQVGTTQLDAGGRVIALTPAGAVKWVAMLPDWVDATPAIGADGTVYVGCWDGKLYALAPDGTRKWAYETGGYIASSPAVSGDGTIYVGSGDYHVHAVRLDGTRKWLYPTADWVDGSPSIGVDGTIYVGAGSTLYAIGPDGIGHWQATLRGGIVGAAAIAANGTVYIASRDKRVYAFTPRGGLLWQFETGDGIEASPVLDADGTLYIGSLDGRMYALNADGTEKWRFPAAGQPALAPIYSSAAVRADGAIVFGSGNNAVYALRPDGTLLWRTPIGDWADSSPVIAADGTIYIGCYDKKLYALHGASTPAASAWPMLKRDAERAAWQTQGLVAIGDGAITNVSVRSMVAADGPPLAVGFYVNGPGERTLLVRGVGPSLAQFGLGEPLTDPRLRILRQRDAQVVVENDAWANPPNPSDIAQRMLALGAFPLGPASRDTAVLREFSSGGFTAEIASANKKRGVVLAEIYDAGGTQARLINLSARARAAAGDGVLTAGFVLSGGTRTLLIRGVGPALTRVGVADVLPDPMLRLFAGRSEPIAENDNWSDAPNATATAAAMLAVGAFALEPGGNDAALLVIANPGAYTVQVSGANGTTGVALIEVYELQ